MIYNEQLITIRHSVIIEKELDCEVPVETHDFAKFQSASGDSVTGLITQSLVNITCDELSTATTAKNPYF